MSHAARSRIPRINALDALAYLERVFGLSPTIDLSFDELYVRWVRGSLRGSFFEELRKLGRVSVYYTEHERIELCAEKGNRHLALALAYFLMMSNSANEIAEVSCPHEQGGIFTATFERKSPNEVSYIIAQGNKVHFVFDATRPCQF